ncbi:hypothetical protein CK489_01920 [Bradyrhizobium sp. UFLA03-84]|uniref:hypothetical protein n=1 Tax=Bradyrhizobium sp. UFLA03-84 TaxID=418599 RepID=UPI000BC9EDBF|nr:hypothetical protein [Bradyrhizobium sp. UFLA03-84]PAY10930.1 hypothetical protein CK489_01920 [Bradyrhizobium sp. UFLA03-84]
MAAIGNAGGQTVSHPEPKPPSKTPAEMAQAIAHSIEAMAHAFDAKAPNRATPPIAFQSATSRDNVVDVHYRANDAGLLPHNKAEGEEERLRFAGRFCFDRLVSLFQKNGVVIHRVLFAPDNSVPFEFTIDQSTCAALIEDAKARAETAERERGAGSNSLDEPKRVHTITVRPEQAEQK